MAQGGFFDGLLDSIQNPLFLGGIGMMGGGVDGLQKGLLAGGQMQEQRKKQAQQQALQSAVMGMPDIPEQYKTVLAASPELATSYLANALAPKSTDDQREYNMARGQGFKGTFMDYQVALKRAGAQQTNIDLKQEGAYDKEMGGLLAKEHVGFMKEGTKAQQDIADLEVMRRSMDNPNVYMGTGGNQVQAVKKAAQTLFGVDVQGVPDGEIIQKTSAKAALGLKDNLPGPMSDSDRKFLMELPASLSSTPEGARRVVSLGITQKRWQAERASAAQEFARRNGGRLTVEVYSALADIDKKYANNMAQLVDGLRSQVPTAPRAPTTGTPLDALRQKYKGLE